MPNNKKRPVFLNLARIHLPVTAILSIGHRVSGVLMVLMIPGLVYLLDLSLADEQGYAAAVGLFRSETFRLLLVAFVWIFTHHLLSGIRFLLIDIDIGVDLRRARASAWTAITGGVVTMFFAALVLL